MEYFAEGSDLYIGDHATVDDTTAWTSVGCVITVTPNTITQSFNEVRPCLNATDRKVKKKPNAIDYGSFGVTFRFNATQYESVKAILVAQTTKAVAAVLGDTGKAFVGSCYVESLGVPELAENGEVTITASFMINDEFDTADADVVGSA